MKAEKSGYEGLQREVKRAKLPEIGRIENVYKDRHYVCEHAFPEFTTLCPKTGLPDFAEIRIAYEPESFLVELRSLKLYFIAFRNLRFFHENFTNRVLDDFVKAVAPRWVCIESKVNVRGGIYTTIRRSWRKKKLDRESELLFMGR